MNLTTYCKDKLEPLCLALILGITGNLFLFVTGTSLGIIILLDLFILSSSGGFFFFTYRKQRKQIQEIESIIKALDQKYLLAECLLPPPSALEQVYFTWMKQMGKSMMEKVSLLELKQEEYQDYIESWVHEVKLPITSIQLLCENNKSEITRKILSQLVQLDSYVERTLYYARSNHVEKDIFIQKVSLQDIVQAALQKNKSLLLENQVQIEVRDLEVEVYSDRKWLEFILGQLILNGIQYKKASPQIVIQAEQKEDSTISLIVEDNGIGIPAHELPRIFEKGFTGSKGRLHRRSTGLGLYLCQKLSQDLGLLLQAQSQEEEYTKIILIFPPTNLTKL